MGPEAEGRAAIQQALDLQPPLSSVRMVPWAQIISSQGFGMWDTAFCLGTADRAIYSVNVRELHAATYATIFSKMRQFYRQHPTARGSTIAMEMWPNQAAMKVPNEETAYPWRDARANMYVAAPSPCPPRPCFHSSR